MCNWVLPVLMFSLMIVVPLVQFTLHIYRLEAYDRNSNFGCTTSDLNHDDDWRMSVPPATSYRDVTGNTILPPISSHTVDQFLHPLGICLNRKARELYDDR